jgi:hypothetical protein
VGVAGKANEKSALLFFFSKKKAFLQLNHNFQNNRINKRNTKFLYQDILNIDSITTRFFLYNYFSDRRAHMINSCSF